MISSLVWKIGTAFRETKDVYFLSDSSRRYFPARYEDRRFDHQPKLSRYWFRENGRLRKVGSCLLLLGQEKRLGWATKLFRSPLKNARSDRHHSIWTNRDVYETIFETCLAAIPTYALNLRQLRQDEEANGYVLYYSWWSLFNTKCRRWRHLFNRIRNWSSYCKQDKPSPIIPRLFAEKESEQTPNRNICWLISFPCSSPLT